ncbi:DotU/TssL family secretion system protein [Dyella monticola]|nr:DotU/TssL family secretion system protein [Dyella monticola]
MSSALLPIALRDTALTVTALRRGASSPSFDDLRQSSHAQVQRLRAELKIDNQSDDVIRDAVYAQCALLDEAALSSLKGSDRDEWEREPLQVAEFGTHDAGEALIARMQQRLHQPQAERTLLAIFLAVLVLGFRGRFVLERRDARAAMIKALQQHLGVSDEATGGIVVRSAARQRWFANVSLPACVLLAVAIAVTLWVLLDRWLDAAAAQLLL